TGKSSFDPSCERSAWVRELPDVSRSYLDASGIPDRWKQAMCVFDPTARAGEWRGGVFNGARGAGVFVGFFLRGGGPSLCGVRRRSGLLHGRRLGLRLGFLR